MTFLHNIKRISCTCLLLFFLAGWNSLLAQHGERIEFNHITREDGLSQSSAHTVYQGSQGFMWFGTNDGLNKYNGYDITTFKHTPDDSTSISGNNISVIYEDDRGNFWVGTTGAGLNRLNRETNEFSHYKTNYNNPGHGISANTVSSILEDSQGKLWVGTYNGLNFFDRDKEQFVHFYSNPADPKSLSSSYINCLYEDKRGNLWIGTKDGLNLWNPVSGTFSSYQHNPDNPNSISADNVMAIFEDDRGNLWVGTTNGLNRFDRDSEQFYRYLPNEEDPHSISGSSIFSVYQDHRGVLWIGTENNGLNTFEYKTGKFYHYTHDIEDRHSLSNNAVYTIYESKNNILWFGTYAGGINYIDRKEPDFEWYKHEPQTEYPLSVNSVTSFLEDNQGNFWVGTDGGGLNRFNRKTGDFYTKRHNPDDKNSLSSDVVLALLDGEGPHIWIGYYDGGLSKYNVKTDTFTHYKHVQGDRTSLCHNDVFDLFRDSDGNIWVGTNGGGVCRFDPNTETFTSYQVAEGVVRDIYEDSRGNFWVATYGGGLKLLDRRKNGIWNFYEGDNGLRSNVILTIHEDQNHKFWVGTKEAGLNLFDRDSLEFTSFTEEDGLPSNQVKGILEDNDGNLWLSTTNGISKFNTRDSTFQNFSIENGLQGREFNTLAYYKDSQGYMYFGGINGFNRFHPDSIGRDNFVHPLVFTDFKIFNKSVEIGKDSPLQKHISQTKEIELPYSASVLTFEYTSLNFNSIKNTKYAYKLEGFDSDWSFVGDKRTATYTNLNPGEYTLHVKTVNAKGMLSDSGTSLTITIHPPFWQTTWFYLLSGVLLIGAVVGIYRLRVKSMKQRNKRLAKEVAKRTEELNKKNKDLQEALKDLKNTRSELLEKAHKAGMADLATGVLHNVGNILNSVNISSAVLEETLEESKIPNLLQASNLLKNNENNLEDFLLNDPKGKKLLNYYIKIEEPLEHEYEQLKKHCKRLTEKVNLIIEVIEAQQNFARVGRINEKVRLEQVVEDTLKLQSGSIERHGLTIQKDFSDTDKVIVQKSKLIHTLVNLLKNAKEAMAEVESENKQILIRTRQDEEHIYLTIIDNGPGVLPEEQKKIFNHGFTTKKQGYGYGLHTCANYMKEMGGNISVKNREEGTGAIFTLSFPRSKVNEADTIRNYEELD